MCEWCTHTFATHQAEDAPFTCGRIIHCPWCDLPLHKASLPPPSNLVGQLSKGVKCVYRDIPSLAVSQEESMDMKECEARKLAEQVMKNSAKMLRQGRAVNVGDATAGTGGSTTATGVSDVRPSSRQQCQRVMTTKQLANTSKHAQQR